MKENAPAKIIGNGKNKILQEKGDNVKRSLYSQDQAYNTLQRIFEMGKANIIILDGCCGKRYLILPRLLIKKNSLQRRWLLLPETVVALLLISLEHTCTLHITECKGSWTTYIAF